MAFRVSQQIAIAVDRRLLITKIALIFHVYIHRLISVTLEVQLVSQRLLRSLLGYVFVGISLVVGYHAIAYAFSTNLIQSPNWSVSLDASALITTPDHLLIPRQDENGDPLSLQALDPATGELQWQSDQAVGRIFAVENDRIYANDYGSMPLVDAPKHVVTLNATTGQTTAIWPIDNPDFEGIIGAYQGAFIVNTRIRQGVETDRYEISAQTADTVWWTFTTPPDSLLTTFASRDSISPFVQDGVVVLPILVNPQTDQRGYQIVGLDAATGAVLWTWQTSSEIEHFAVLGDAVYPSVYGADAANPGWVKALDLKTGAERWTYPMLGGHARAVNDQEVLIWSLWFDAEQPNRLLLLDRQTGTLKRQLLLPREFDTEATTVLFANDVVYTDDMNFGHTVPVPGFYGTAENNSWVDAFDATDGHLLWRTPTLSQSHIYQFVLTDDHLFVKSNGLQPDVESVVQQYSLHQR